MADGRKIPYIIEMGINDEKLKRQMSQWDWEEIIGIKGFGKHFGKPAKEASDAIENAFANTSIDWEKALQTDAFKSAVTKIVQHANKELREGLLGKDEARQVTEFVSEIGKEWKEVGVAMDASGFVRSMKAFSGSVETLLGDVEKLKTAFSGLEDKINTDTAKVAGGFTVIGDAAGRAAVKVNKSIETMEAKLASIDAMFSKDYSDNFKFDTNLEAQFYGIDEAIEKVEGNIDELSKKFNKMSSSDKDFEATRRSLVQLYADQIELYRQLEIIDEKYTKKNSKNDSLLTLNQIDSRAVINEARTTIETIVGDAKRQLKDISASTKTTKDGINIPIKLPSQAELVKTINNYVKSINDSDTIHGVRLKLDGGWLNDAANVIEDATKRAYGNNPADFDKNTTDLVEKTKTRFGLVAGAIKDKQDEIVEQTQNWRQQMKDAMDIEFKWASDGSATLFNAIQDYFDENQIEVTLNKQALSEQFKAAFQDAGINMSGKVGVDAKSLQSIVSSILYGTKGGQSINDVDNDIPSDVESSTSEIEKSIEDVVDANRKYVSSLDDAPDQVREVIENLKGLIKYAIDGDSKNAIKTRERLHTELFPGYKKEKDQSVEGFGLDIANRLSGLLEASDDDIKRIINDAVLRFNPTYGFEGAKVRDDLTELKSVDKISTKKLSGFLNSLNNLFTALGLQTDDVVEIERRIASKGIFEETLKKAKVGKSIAGLRSIAGNEDLTKVPTMDEIRTLISNMKDEGLDTTSANELLGWRDALGDTADEGSLATFREQLKNFVTGVDEIYQGIKRIVKEYEATVKVVDQVSDRVDEIAVKGSGTRGGVKFDNIINAGKNIERAMNDGKKVGYTTHKAYGSWRILGGSKETRNSEAKALRGTKNTYTTPKTQEDPRGYDVSYNGIPDPSIDIIATIERTISQNESKISQLNSKLTKQRKELKKLIEENAEQSILDAKQAEIDADVKVRDEIKAQNKKDKLQLDSLKLQKEERDVKTIDDYTRESIQVIDSQITETQAKIDGLKTELASVDERLASVAPTKNVDFVNDEFASQAKDLNKQAIYVDIVATNKADWIQEYAKNFKSEEEVAKTKEIATKYNEEENAYNQILSGLNSRIASANEISKHIKVGQKLNTKLSTLENELNQMQPEYDKFSEEVKVVRESYNQHIDKLTKEMNRAKKDSTKESKRQQIRKLESERSHAIVNIEDKYRDTLTRRESVVNEIATTKSQIAANDGWINQKKQEIDVIDANIQRLQSLKEATEDVERVKLLDSAIAKAQSERTVLSQMIGDPEGVISETKKEIANLGQFVSSVDKDVSEMYDRWHKEAVGAQKDLATMREPIAKQFRAEYKATVDQIFDFGKQLEKNPADETLRVQFQNAVEYLRILESEYAKFIRITNNDGVKHKPLIGKDKKEQLSGLINTYGDNAIGNAAVLGRKSQIEADLKTSNRDLEKLNEQREQQQSTLLTEIDEEEQERLDKLKSIQEKRAKVDEQIAKFGYNQVRLPDDVDDKEKERIALNETKTIQALMSKAYDKRNAYRSDVLKYSREVEDLDKWRGISGPGRKIAREFPNQLVGEYKTSDHYKAITLNAKEEVGGDELAKAIQENIERRESAAIESYINNLRAKSNQNIEVEVDKYRRTDEYKTLDVQAQKETAQRYKAKLQAEADRANKELLAQYQSSDRFKKIAIDAKSEVMKTGSEFSFQFTPDQWKVIEEKQRVAIKEYTDSIIYDDDTKKHTYTKYVKNEDGVEEAVRVTVDIFDDLLQTLKSKLEYAQGKFEQAQAEVESLQSAQKEVREYGHLDSDAVYNQNEVSKLRSTQTLKEEATNDRNSVLRQLALLEEQKILLGEIENLKSKGEGDKALEPYQDKLKEINEELNKLYEKYKVNIDEEDKDSKLETKIKTAEKRLSEQIANYEATEKAIQQRIFNKNEQRAQSKNPRESEQRILASIENYNKNIEKSQERQRQLKEKIAEATGVERDQLQRQLESAERNERNLETRRNNQNKNLDRLRKKQTEVVNGATETGVSTSGGLLGLIKEAMAGSGGVSDEILREIADVVSKILEAITSGGVKISADSKVTSKDATKNVALEKKLARIRVLEAEKAASVNKYDWTSAMSEEERKASIATANKYDKNTVNKWKDMGADELINVMQDITRSMDGLNKESVEYLAKQRELGRVLNVYKTKSSVKDDATVTKKNGKSYINSRVLAEKDEALKQLGLYDKYDPITSDLAIRNMFATPKNEGFSKKKEEELAHLKQEIKEVNATAKDNGGLRDAIPEETAQETDELTVKIERLKQKFEEAKKVGYIDKNDADLKAFESATDKNEALRYGDKVSAKVSKNRRAYSGTTEMNAVNRQRDNMDARGILGNDDLDSVKAYNKAYSDLIAKHREFSTAGTLYDPENQKIIQKMAINVKALGKELETAQTKSENLQQKVANSGLYNGQAIGDMSQVAQGTDMYEQMRAKLEELGATNIKIDRIHQRATGTIRHNDRLVSDLEVSYDELTGSLARYHRQERESLTGLPAFLNGFKKKFNSIMQYLTMTMSIHRVLAELRKGIQYVREIDLALTELRKVTDETEETYDKFLDAAAKTGARLGSTISAVTEATATFAKLGYSMEQATEMAEAAIVYKNVGDNIASTEDAADSIISTMKGFKLEASEAMAIVDRFNEVGNRFAVTSQGLGEALRLSASALNEGGNSLDESIGLITAANEVVNDPSSVGTALKTLTLRLRGSKTELEEMGEDVSDMATTTSQLQAKLLALTGGKVDIMLDANTFKNSTQILREMAAAWEDMNDIQRASALELMGGKRQANVLSALIQNFDTVEKVIETSANSSGSALKENERYLDSIQGKIDQFNNAVQTMWSNALDSDMVKGIVSFGTEIIKVIDKIGLLKSALIAIATISMIKNKMGPIAFLGGISDIIKNVVGKAGSLIGSLVGITTATSAYTAETLAASVANGTMSASEAASIATKNGLAMATTKLTSVETLELLTKQGIAKADALDIINKLKLGKTSKLLTADKVKEILVSKGVKDATIQEALAAIFGAGANKTLAASFIALWAAIWPILAVMAAVGIIYGVVKAIDAAVKTTAELSEELDGLKSELSDLESDLESINSELDKTQERMAELLALPSLSFTEQEELKNLQLQNAELERQLQLKEMLLESKQKETVKKSEEYIDSAWNRQGDWYVDKNGVIHKDSGWKGFWNDSKDTKTVLDTAIQKYDLLKRSNDARSDFKINWDSYVDDGISYDEYAKMYLAAYKQEYNGSKEDFDKLSSEQATKYANNLKNYILSEQETKWIEDDMLNIAQGINMVFADQNFDDLEYGMSEKIDTFLDEMYAYQLKWRQAQGQNIKSEAISSMFDATSTKEMQDLKAELQKIMDDDAITDKNKAILDKINGLDGTADATVEVDKLADSYNRLGIAMDVVGVTAQDIADYFVLETGAFDSSTMDGIIAQYELGLKNLKSMQGDESLFNQVFDADGDVIETKIAEMMKGADETTRKEFAKLLKSIKDGKYQTEDGLTDWAKAMESFSLSGGLRGVQVVADQLSEINVDIFPGLEDEIDGIINKFDELVAAVGDTVDAMDALEQARAEEAYSGSVSLETLEKLMQSTDNYADLIEVDETGAIKLATNAQEILVQEKIDTIKKNAALALSTAQLQLAEAKHNQQIYQESSPAQEVLRSALAEVGGAAAFVTSLWGDLTSGNLVGAWERAKTAREASINTKKEGWANDAAAAATSVADAEKAVADAQKMNDIAQGLTVDNIKQRYDSDEASGGNGTKDEVIDDAFQREMDYWENRLSANQAKRDQIQNEIDFLEAQGKRAGEEYYKELIALEEERKALLIAQRNEALAYLSTQEEGSEEWWNAASIVNDLEGEIDDATASIQDFADAQAQIKWDNLEEITSRFSDLHDEISDLRDILQREDMFDEDGNWTESGAAVLGTYVHDLEAYKNELAMLQSEIADLQAHPYNEANAAYLKETYGIDSEQEYNDLLTQWNQTQRDMVKGAYDTADAIKDAYSQQVDAIEDAINEQIDAYNDYIDVVKEAYDAERELYEFKKDIQKQSKSIAETERRIASLSGSTNAADIAERRKLEAQLAEQRESINDSYYSHANDQRNNALDNEAQAYEDSMNRYVEGLRETLEEQAQELITFNETGAMVTNEFLNGVTATVLENAGIILTKYEEISPYMSDELKQPWIDASAQLDQYGNDLSVLNAWTSDSGYFGKFKTTASGQLTTPFINGSAAASAFKTSTTSAMDSIASNVRSNVSNITSNLGSVQSAYSGIITTANQAKAAIDQANAAAAAGASYTGTAGSNYGATVAPAQVDSRILSKYKLTSDQVLALGYGPISLEKFEDLLRNYLIKYSNKFSKAQVWNTDAFERSIGDFGDNYVSGPWAIRQYAKGTTGTTRDEWAITDEHRFGDELVLVPGKDGNLSFMRKGTGVVPADLTANLMEWGQFTPDSLNLNGGANINMINNAVNKPEFNLSFEALVKAERIDENTLPEVKKYVQQEINSLVKQMNYAIKGKGGR